MDVHPQKIWYINVYYLISFRFVNNLPNQASSTLAPCCEAVVYNLAICYNMGPHIGKLVYQQVK